MAGIVSGLEKCQRATDYRKGKYVYCGKPATWIATDTAHDDQEFGLCDECLAEMRGGWVDLLGNTPVRPVSS